MINNPSSNSSRTSSTGGYSKVLAIFNKQTGNLGPMFRSWSAQVILKDKESYEQSLLELDSTDYETHAGCDLSALLMPFCSSAGSGSMPSFHVSAKDAPTTAESSDPSGVPIKNYKILPFKWEKNNNTIVYDRSLSPSGDSLGYVVSDTLYRGDVNRYRDPSNIRSLGFRFPMMGVGWGYTTAGQPFPSGNSKTKFKGELSDGTQVNPCDYVAAPVDFRYNIRKNIWTIPVGFWAEITGLASGTSLAAGDVSGMIYYSWREKKPNASGIMVPLDSSEEGQSGRKGSIPALEVNRNGMVPSGTNVWIYPSDRTDLVNFQFNGEQNAWVKIISYTDVPDRPNVWQYSFVEQSLGRLNQWSDKIGGYSTSRYGFYAYNSVEANNSDSGVQGNSINVSTLPAPFSISPIIGNPVLKAQIIPNCSGMPEFIVSYENAVVGDCT